MKCFLTDLHSTNGTWLNRAKLRAFVDVEVQPGDMIALGEPGLAFRLAAVDAERQQTAVAAALQLLPPPEVPPACYSVPLLVILQRPRYNKPHRSRGWPGLETRASVGPWSFPGRCSGRRGA